MKTVGLITSTFIAALAAAPPALATGSSRVEVVHVQSQSLKGTLTGVDPERDIYVYLPPGYEEGATRYPVVYYLHSINWSAKQTFADGSFQARIDRAIAKGATRPFILVAPEYSTA